MSPRDVHHDDMFDDDPTLSAFARDLQDAAAAGPAPEVGATLAAVLSGQAPATAYPEMHVPHVRQRATRRLVRVRWAVGGLALASALSVLGVAGTYPDPVQRQVSRMAEVVGVDLPDGEPATTTTSTTTTTTTPPTTTTIGPPPTSVVTGENPDIGGADGPATTTTLDDREDDDDRGRGRGRGGGDDEDDDGGSARDRGEDDEDGEDGEDGDDEGSGRGRSGDDDAEGDDEDPEA